MADPRDSRADAFDNLFGLVPQNPGQNVFAEREVRTHRARLQGNAWYQQQYLEERGLSPETVHPAFTEPDLISDLSKPIPQMSHNPSQHPNTRESDITTMSQFIPSHDGQGDAHSPPLNLGTTPDHTPRPTQRALIEDYHEARQHAASGSDEERIPVYEPSPEFTDDEFDVEPAGRMKKTVQISDYSTEYHQAPPKKGFFSRFGAAFSKSKPEPKADTTATTVTTATASPSRPPPKAQQILGTHRVNAPLIELARSPSKSRGLFRRARRNTGGDEMQADATNATNAIATNAAATGPPPRASTSLGHFASSNSPPRASTSMGPMQGSRQRSDPANRMMAQVTTYPERETPVIGRSTSLKYMDCTIPPTPPSKDTPPDERAIRQAGTAAQDPIVPFNTDTPTRSQGFFSTQPGLSPARLGSYGQAEKGRLVTRKSQHSMRASIVPDEMEQSTFDEVSHRMGGLAIEGFNLPAETRRSQKPYAYETTPRTSQAVDPQYSPSVYSQPSPRQNRRSTMRQSISAMPSLRAPLENVEEKEEPPQAQETGTQDASARSSGITASDRSTMTVPIMYPEFASDPNYLRQQREAREREEEEQQPRQEMQMRAMIPQEPSSSSMEVWPDLRKDPEINDFMTFTGFDGNFSTKGQKAVRHIGKILGEDSPTLNGLVPAPAESNGLQRSESTKMSLLSALPTSPSPSITVPPLKFNSKGQEILPQTTYSPPSARGKQDFSTPSKQGSSSTRQMQTTYAQEQTLTPTRSARGKKTIIATPLQDSSSSAHQQAQPTYSRGQAQTPTTSARGKQPINTPSKEGKTASASSAFAQQPKQTLSASSADKQPVTRELGRNNLFDNKPSFAADHSGKAHGPPEVNFHVDPKKPPTPNTDSRNFSAPVSASINHNNISASVRGVADRPFYLGPELHVTRPLQSGPRPQINWPRRGDNSINNRADLNVFKDLGDLGVSNRALDNNKPSLSARSLYGANIHVDEPTNKSSTTSGSRAINTTGNDRVDASFQNIMGHLHERNAMMQEHTTAPSQKVAAFKERKAANELQNKKTRTPGDISDSGVSIQDQTTSANPDQQADKKGKKAKRLSTNYAHDFYRTGDASDSAVSPTVPDSEASTIILTPNQSDASFPAAAKSKAALQGIDLASAAAARQVSGTHPALRAPAPPPQGPLPAPPLPLRAAAPTAAAGSPAGSTSAVGSAEMDRLTSMVSVQQVMLNNVVAQMAQMRAQLAALQVGLGNQAHLQAQEEEEEEEGEEEEEFINPA